MHVLRYKIGCFRHCEILLSCQNFLAASPAQINFTPAENYYACGYFNTCSDTNMTYCYVKRLYYCFQKLNKKFKNRQTIKTIFKTYKCKGFVCIPSPSAILCG